MRFVRQGTAHPATVAILAGSFNPPTVAHLALADAARGHAEQVVCVAPAALPHKEQHGATVEERARMLLEADPAEAFAVAISEGGLFIDIARECREHYGERIGLYFVCGRDAAERIVSWDYGRPGAAEQMLADFELLVAPRSGDYVAPGHLRRRIHALPVGGNFEAVSSTGVRERIRRGEPWEHLVPAGIVEQARRIYS
jgi:nicotinate-nucleotide adenylyltransferase